MLRRLEEIRGYELVAPDGIVGTLNDVFLDDETWTVRYLTVDTGLWLGRLVLVSPISFGTPDWQGRRIPVTVTRDEIEQSPDLLGRARFTREEEREFAAYYGYPQYWGGSNVWGWAQQPSALTSAPPAGYVPPGALEPDTPEAVAADVLTTSIFSGGDIRGYHIHALDGEIGHVDDFIIDEDTWSIRYLQIDTSNWIGGKTVLLATRWVRRIDPADGKIHVEATKERIENSPEFDPGQPIDRTFEERLHQHYGLPAYWERERARMRTMGAGGQNWQ
jgi:sporulation protein YlmC with PRC-barrel domain